jgi:hypothetical protein
MKPSKHEAIPRAQWDDRYLPLKVPVPNHMGVRLYSVSPLCPEGKPEDTKRCAVAVPELRGERRLPSALHQCGCKRGSGEGGQFCGSHAMKMKRREQEQKAAAKRTGYPNTFQKF